MPTTTTGHEIYAAQAIKGLTRQLAALKAFSIDFSADASRKGESVNVGLVTADAVAEFDSTTNNFKRSAQEVKQVSLKFGKPLITGFCVTPDQLNNFNPSWWADKANLNVLEVCDTVLAGVAAKVTGANYGDTAKDKMTVSLSGFNKAVVAAIRAKAIKDKKLRIPLSVLALDPIYFSELLGSLDANVYGGKEAIQGGMIPGLFGFRAVIEVPQLGIPGFVCSPDAIAIAARSYQPASKKPYESVQLITEPETGLTLTHVEYCSGDDGELSDSVNALVQSGVGNSAALMRLVEAAPAA